MARFTSRATVGASGVLGLKELQLAQLVDEPPEGPQWFHEQKLDGYRIVASGGGAHVQLLSRRFKDWTKAFPSIAEAVGKLPAKTVVLDGEVCVVMPDGRTSFQALQNALSGAKVNLAYFIFDVLAIDGETLTALPLEARKVRLKTLLKKAPGALRYCDHVEGNGGAFFAAACKAGLEGIISKKRDQPYSPGRGKGWVKTKRLSRQER